MLVSIPRITFLTRGVFFFWVTFALAFRHCAQAAVAGRVREIGSPFDGPGVGGGGRSSEADDGVRLGTGSKGRCFLVDSETSCFDILASS